MFSTTVANYLLDSFIAAYDTYLALSSTQPTVTGANVTEPVGNGYARVLIPRSSWAAATGRQLLNTSQIILPEATGAWGIFPYFALYTELTGGTFLFRGTAPSTNINTGDRPTINVGDLIIQLD